MEFASESQWQNHIIRGGAFLDVRAPVEFADGTIPGSQNIPLLNDDERHQVGITYKKDGPEAALALGHELVNGKVKSDRIEQWISFIKNNPSALLFCFRGGKRSAITQTWLKENGVNISRVQGGYKAMRTYLLNSLNDSPAVLKFLTIGGSTGSGKTLLIQKLKRIAKFNVIDLERLARHRGSAFGAELVQQPRQVDFENQLAVELIRAKANNSAVIVEDESRTIGKISLPDSLFTKMRLGPLVWIDEKRGARAEIIRQEYVLRQIADLRQNHNEHVAWQILELRLTEPLMKIRKKLGGVRFESALALLSRALRESQFLNRWESHNHWIEYLLEHYYDEYYVAHAKRCADRIVFRGRYSEVENFLRDRLNRSSDAPDTHIPAATGTFSEISK